MADTPQVRCVCGKRMRKALTDFSTSKDKRYEFTTQHVKPRTEIRSKGQWERFLRNNKLTDDLSHKEQLERVRSNYFEKRSQERRAERLEGIKRDLRKAAADQSIPLRQFPHQRKMIEKAFGAKGA